MAIPFESANVAFEGSVPQMYDRYLGPVLFEPYARHLAQRLVSSPAIGPVLETACGTGILTRQLRDVLDPDVSLTATDLNEPMIAHARGMAGADRRVTWRQADATALPFDAGTFGAVVCQFGMMFVPDKGGAIREARRVLNRQGWFGFSVWSPPSENPFGRLAHEVIGSFFRTDPPTFYQVPYSWNDPAVIDGLLKSNGFKEIQIERVTLEAHAPSATDFARGLVEGNPVIQAIRDARLEVGPIIDALAAALVKEGGDKPHRSPINALIASGHSS